MAGADSRSAAGPRRRDQRESTWPADHQIVMKNTPSGEGRANVVRIRACLSVERMNAAGHGRVFNAPGCAAVSLYLGILTIDGLMVAAEAELASQQFTNRSNARQSLRFVSGVESARIHPKGTLNYV